MTTNTQDQVQQLIGTAQMYDNYSDNTEEYKEQQLMDLLFGDDEEEEEEQDLADWFFSL